MSADVAAEILQMWSLVVHSAIIKVTFHIGVIFQSMTNMKKSTLQKVAFNPLK